MTTKKRKTVGRFHATHAELAGDSGAAHDSGVGGVVGGLAATEAVSGYRVRTIETADLVPHPFNDPRRSEVGESERWQELVRNIAKNGVQVPVLAVTREAFLAARPSLADSVAQGSHVLVYGHRRRAAALSADVSTMPVVVDDTVLDGDGDIDRMALENLGREDLPPLAEARLYARYSEDVGLTQSAIAERLGVDQGTISRRLSLLLLTPDAREAFELGHLPATAAAALAGALPYGPVRGWQRAKKSDQDSPTREDDQNRALSLVVDHGVSPSRAAELVSAERGSRSEAAERGIELVSDPSTALGGVAVEVSAAEESDRTVVGTIDDVTGSLLLWSLADAESAGDSTNGDDTPSPEPRPHAANDGDPAAATTSQHDDASILDGTDALELDEVDNTREDLPRASTDTDDQESAAEARRRACARAAQHVPSKTRMAEILAEVIAHGVDTTAPEVAAQANIWLTADTKETADPYALHAALAWRQVLAGYESAAVTAGSAWGPAQRTYIELLAERVKGFTPTAWERTIMHAA